jgi:hypothetical protein
MMRKCAMARSAAIVLTIACSPLGNGASAQVFGRIDTLAGFRVLPWFIDQDMDGKVDALIINDDQVLLRTNTGDTVFTDPSVFAAIPTGGRVLLIDRIDPLDGIDMIVHTEEDSTLMLISDIGQQNTVRILDTTFSADYTSVFGFANRGRPAVKVGRFDADALPDIFMSTFGGTGKWYRNMGDGGYALGTVATNYGFPWDHEGDGDLDLFQGPVVGNALSVSVTYSSVTDTVLGSPTVPLGFSSLTGYTGQMEVADIDGNGEDDLVIAGAIILRMPGPTNELLCCAEEVDGFRFRQALDLDCDPDLEVLDANSQAGYVVFSIQDFTGTGVIVHPFADSTMSTADITVADIDADGRTDLVYQEPGDTVVHIRWNRAHAPSVALDLQNDVFELGAVVALNEGVPPGGLYLGPGIFGDSLYTALAGEGPLTITYVYQDPFTGCTDSASAVVDIVIGMNEQVAGRLTAAPNPAGLEVRITSPMAVSGELIVRDPSGKTCITLPHVRLGMDRSLSIPVGHLAPGLYHVSLVPEAGPAISAGIMIAR